METGVSEIAVVLATLDEAGNLPSLVEALENLGEDLDIIVVDDNSRDGTQEIARELSESLDNLTVINRPGRLGLGSALRDGLAAALAKGALYVVTMDADWSHDPADLPRLLEVIRAGEAGMVQGSRYVSGGGARKWGLRRRLMSRAANLLYHWGTGAPHESTTNFRALSRTAAAVISARARGNGYEFMPEATLLVMAAGMRVQEVPITFTGRERGESKMGGKQVLNSLTAFVSDLFQYRLRLGRYSRQPYRENPIVE